MHSGLDRRQNPRNALSGGLLISWQDGAGTERICGAHCIDVSATGLRLRVLDKLPSRAIVLFNSLEIGIAGRGTVRFCVARRAAYEVGIECPSGTRAPSLFNKIRTAIPKG